MLYIKCIAQREIYKKSFLGFLSICAKWLEGQNMTIYYIKRIASHIARYFWWSYLSQKTLWWEKSLFNPWKEMNIFHLPKLSTFFFTFANFFFWWRLWLKWIAFDLLWFVFSTNTLFWRNDLTIKCLLIASYSFISWVVHAQTRRAKTHMAVISLIILAILKS